MIATYVDSYTFTVEGEWDSEFLKGRKLVLSQANAGTSETAVESSVYDSYDDITTVTVMTSVVTSNLVSVRRASSAEETVGWHSHSALSSGGFMPASRFSDTQVDAILSTTDPVMIWRHAWVEDTLYSIGHCVNHLGHFFISILAHTSSAAEEPLNGIYWEDYWEQVV